MRLLVKSAFGRFFAQILITTFIVIPGIALAQEAPPEQRDTLPDDWCEWKVRLSPGATVWFFDKENTLLGGAGFVDVWRTDYPINFHMGVEGRHMFLGQDEARFASEFEGKTPRVTFLRIPFALEYMEALDTNYTWYIGGGPDIIHTANDLEDTNVGMHIGTRVHYAFDNHWGMALEVGYAWGDVDGQSEDVKVDSAYITPTLAYTF